MKFKRGPWFAEDTVLNYFPQSRKVEGGYILVRHTEHHYATTVQFVDMGNCSLALTPCATTHTSTACSGIAKATHPPGNF